MKNQKTVILIPGFSGIYQDLYRLAKKASEGSALITVNLKKTGKMAEKGHFKRAVILMGAKFSNTPVDAATAYRYLRKANKKLEIVVADGWDWNIPKQLMLPGRYTLAVIKKALG